MNHDDDLNRAERALRELDSAVLGLRVSLGSHLDVLRLADDVVRCTADLSRLSQDAFPARRRLPHQQDLVVVPDGDYDASLWADGDVDAEGLGAPGRRAP